MTTSGWAIKWTWTDDIGVVRTGLLDRIYFHNPHGVVGHLEGYQTAVFRTRQRARDAALVAGKGYDHATAVKVNVTVAEELIPGYVVAA